MSWLNDLFEIFKSSANILHWLVREFGKSFIYIANKVGPRMLPCGIPLVTLHLFEQEVPTFTHCNRLDKRQEIHVSNLMVMP